MLTYSKQLPIIATPDVLVCGGGLAGIGAAVAAARMGATTMLSFILYAIIIIWVFAAKNLRRIWATIVTSTVVCSALAWLLLPGAV